MRRHWGWWAGNWHDSCSKANTQTATWRVTEHTGWELRPVWRSREEGPGGSSGIPTRCQALPGARTGILKQERQGSCPQEEPVCVCVGVCVWSVKSGVRVLCVCGVRILGPSCLSCDYWVLTDTLIGKDQGCWNIPPNEAASVQNACCTSVEKHHTKLWPYK